jgi:thiopurine S-methyltransferase
MDPEFWHERWARGEIGFHQNDFNAHMQAYMASLGLAGGASVLVPLCGKSRDMLWLADQGFRVAGIEISRQAVGDFFEENGLAAEVDHGSGATRYRNGSIEIWLADFFRFDASVMTAIDAVYDRAALVALPPEMRAAYAARLISMIPSGVPMLLITLDYPEAEMKGPPFPVTASEVHDLFGGEFDIRELHSEDCLAQEARFRKKGLTRMLEQVHLLRRHG